MANTRSERLQQQKKNLTQLVNRKPMIRADAIEEVVLTALQSQIEKILNNSKKILLPLIEKITDGLDDTAMEALEDEINQTLFILKNAEENDINAAYQSGLDYVQLRNNLKATPERTTTPPPEAQTEIQTETPTKVTPTETPSVLTGLLGLFNRAPAPKVIPPTTKKDNLSPQAVARKAAWHTKTTMFPYEDQKPNAPLATSNDEKAPEADAQITTIARRNVRRVDTEELFTPRTPTKAN